MSLVLIHPAPDEGWADMRLAGVLLVVTGIVVLIAVFVDILRRKRATAV